MTDIKKPPEAVSSGGDAVPTAGKIAAERRQGEPVFTGGNAVPTAGGKLPPSGGGGAGVHRREQKGTGHQVWFPVPS